MTTSSDALKTSERFNSVEPIERLVEIETYSAYPEEIGKIWLCKNWLTVAEARELRDWLNKAIP